MNRFVICTDSGSDLPLDIVQKYQIHVLPLTVHFKHESYRNYPDQREITNHDFYARLREKQVAKTSQINAEDFIQAVTPLLEQGLDLLVISISSALSGSHDAMVLGSAPLLERFPNQKIVIIDSLAASLGEGFLVYQAALKQQEGLSLEATAAFLDQMKQQVCAIFTVEELGTLQRGGRISLTKAVLGTLLNMKPILKIDRDGKLVPIEKARGRKNAVNALLNKFNADIVNEDIVFIVHADCEEEALRVKDEISIAHPHIKQFIVAEIGPVIGAHAGPGTIALVYVGSAR